MNHALQELHEITDTKLAVISEDGIVLTSVSAVTKEQIEEGIRFLKSEAPKMSADGISYIRVFTGDARAYALFAEGTQAETVALIAVSELHSIEAATRKKVDRLQTVQQILTGELAGTALTEHVAQCHLEDSVERRILQILVTEERQNAVVQALRTYYGSEQRHFVIPMGEGRIALVTESEEDEAALLYDILTTEAMVSCHIAVGKTVRHLSELAEAYREAQTAMAIREIFYPDTEIIYYNHLGIGRLIYHLTPELCQLFLQEAFDRRVIEELDEETLHIIQSFFDNNLNISETARQLYIHRNTLVYRLEKLERMTGLDIRKFEHAMTFKIGLMVIHYLKAQN